MQQLTHVDQSGQAFMVDVSQKAVTTRQATATALLQTTSQVIQLIELQLVKKGDVLSTARLAGIMAAKQTSQLIPLCHPLPLSQVQVHFQLDQTKGQIRIQCCCKVSQHFGVMNCAHFNLAPRLLAWLTTLRDPAPRHEWSCRWDQAPSLGSLKR